MWKLPGPALVLARTSSRPSSTYRPTGELSGWYMQPFVAKRRRREWLPRARGDEEGYAEGCPSGFFQNRLTDCRRRSTSHTVYSLCSYVTRWHGADCARTETAGMRKTKRARPNFEGFSTWIRWQPVHACRVRSIVLFLGPSLSFSRRNLASRRSLNADPDIAMVVNQLRFWTKSH